MRHKRKLSCGTALAKLVLLTLAFGIGGCSMPTGPIPDTTSSPDTETTGPGPTPSYVLTINVIGSGSVTNSAGKTTFASGESVTLTAVAGAHSFFSAWSGSITSSQSQVSLAMTSNRTVTATFIQAVRDVRFAYEAASSSVNGSFVINYGLRNFGNVPVQFTSAAFAIYGSGGGVLTDVVKTADTFPTGVVLQPGQEVFATLQGYSAAFIPFSFAFQINCTDGLGHPFSIYPNYSFVVM